MLLLLLLFFYYFISLELSFYFISTGFADCEQTLYMVECNRKFIFAVNSELDENERKKIQCGLRRLFFIRLFVHYDFESPIQPHFFLKRIELNPKIP